MHMGARDSILFGIKADECEDIVIHKDGGENQFIASLSAHLRFRDEKYIKPEYADKYIKIFAKTFLEALARPGGKVLVIARPVNYSWQAIGERMRYLRIEFEIEDYHVMQ